MKYGYKKVKQKFLWFRWAFVFIFPLLVLFTIFGEGGIIHNYVLSLKLGKLNEALTELDSQNLRLQREIRNSITNKDYAQITRTRHALVAPQGSVIYRFASDQNPSMSIGESLNNIDEENSKNVIFASFLGDLWVD